MGEIDGRTVAGLKATLVRASEQGDAGMAASLYGPGGAYLSVFRRRSDGAWRWAIDMKNSDAG